MDKRSLIGWILLAFLFVLMFQNMNKQRLKAEQERAEKAKTEQTEQATSDATDNNSTVQNGTTTNLNSENAPATTTALSDSARQVLNNSEYGIFAGHVEGSEEDLVVENDVLKITFNNKGGVPKSVILKEFKTNKQLPLEVFSTNNSNKFNVKLFTNTLRANLYTDALYFEPSVKKESSGSQVVSFKLKGPNNEVYEHRYVIPAEGYLIDFDINMSNLQSYVADNYFQINWNQVLNSQEGSLASERMYSHLYYADRNLDVDKLGMRKNGDKDVNKSMKWVSFKQKFFNATLIADDELFSDESKLNIKQGKKEDAYVKKYGAVLDVEYNRNSEFSYPMQFYFGPNNYKTLKSLDVKLQKIVQIGGPVLRQVNLYFIIPVFNFLNKYIGSYGIIILILTIIIKMIVFPFTFKSHLSMIKMRVLQPELAELRKKFGKDQQKMGQAQMELYRKAGVNPLGGCLPMLFQMPILIAMYRFFPSSLELRQQGFLWANDLSTYDSIYNLPFEIPAYGAHISLFTILMAITSFFYTRINSQNTPTDPNNPMAAQMKMFQYIMPFMLLFIFNKFSAALSYYYFLFNLISIAQYYFMKKFLIDEDKIHAELQENKKKVRKKSKWQTKMEEIMKQQEDARRQQQKRKK